MTTLPRECFWAGRRVLLTGHTGFKGSWLALWLLQLGAEVHGLGLPPDTSPSLFEQLALAPRLASHLLVDIRDPVALAAAVWRCQPQVVLHLAAQPLVRRAYREPLATWNTNVMGCLHLLEALRPLSHACAVVMVTSDKVYANREWLHGYRETDRLGGRDPYSASKAAAELAIASWRASYCGEAPHQTSYLAIATARAGNVIGGGDWAEDRLVPDAMRAWASGLPLAVRRPASRRPWQHVLEPLSGYLRLAEHLSDHPDHPSGAGEVETMDTNGAWNFGPAADGMHSVADLLDTAHRLWPGGWAQGGGDGLEEAGLLHLHSDKAQQLLGWRPRWPFATAVERTVTWYRDVHEGSSAEACCLADLSAYQAGVA